MGGQYPESNVGGGFSSLNRPPPCFYFALGFSS
jgi:hypothetical protein